MNKMSITFLSIADIICLILFLRKVKKTVISLNKNCLEVYVTLINKGLKIFN